MILAHLLALPLKRAQPALQLIALRTRLAGRLFVREQLVLQGKQVCLSLLTSTLCRHPGHLALSFSRLERDGSLLNLCEPRNGFADPVRKAYPFCFELGSAFDDLF